MNGNPLNLSSYEQWLHLLVAVQHPALALPVAAPIRAPAEPDLSVAQHTLVQHAAAATVAAASTPPNVTVLLLLLLILLLLLSLYVSGASPRYSGGTPLALTPKASVAPLAAPVLMADREGIAVKLMHAFPWNPTAQVRV